MKHQIFLLLSLIFLIASIQLNGQALITKKDSIALGNDTIVKMVLPEYRGNIQWQKSLDGKNWNNLVGQTKDSLTVKSDEEAIYRAAVSDGTCLPIYSDSVSLIFIKPTVKTLRVDSVLHRSANLNGNLILDGGTIVTDAGFYIHENLDSLCRGNKLHSTTVVDSFSFKIANLKPGTKYYMCAFATNNRGTVFGDTISFETLFIDQLSDSQLKVLDSIGINTTFRFKDAVFPDGSSMSQWDSLYASKYILDFTKHGIILSGTDKKTLFINLMTKAGLELTDDNLHIYPSQPNGLAYVYNSKNIKYPYTCPTNECPTVVCHEPLYGLDCSGMIYLMAKSFGLNLNSQGTVSYVLINTWNNAFKNSTDFQGLEMTDLYALPVDQFQPGDIIVASEVHIGLVAGDKSNMYILNSQGGPKKTCEENKLTGRGPVVNPNIAIWLKAIFGTNYHVLRTKFSEPPGGNTFVDSRDGHVYKWVQIGTQIWMAENLAWLPSVKSPSNGSETEPYYYVCGYFGTNVTAAKTTSNYSTYGVLYNWPAAMKACPSGWHVSSNAEATILSNFLGGKSVSGGKLKEIGTTHWLSPNTNATNESGFSALPGGYRMYDGNFSPLGGATYYWTSNEYIYGSVYSWGVGYLYIDFELWTTSKEPGYSVRCVRDN